MENKVTKMRSLAIITIFNAALISAIILVHLFIVEWSPLYDPLSIMGLGLLLINPFTWLFLIILLIANFSRKQLKANGLFVIASIITYIVQLIIYDWALYSPYYAIVGTIVLIIYIILLLMVLINSGRILMRVWKEQNPPNLP